MTFPERTAPLLRAAVLVGLASSSAAAPQTAPAPSPKGAAVASPRQTQADDYTRYELLDPSTASFRILYEVTATTPGARYFWNPIRKGSIASNESVTDPVNGKPLKFVEVSGEKARENGLPNADLDTEYIQIELPRPVPAKGEVRLLIDKTYKDAKSYFVEDGTGFIVFSRSLGIKRNSVVLPPGYEVVACSYPSQVIPETAPGASGGAPSSRLMLSFMNIGPDAVSYVVKARRVK